MKKDVLHIMRIHVISCLVQIQVYSHIYFGALLVYCINICRLNMSWISRLGCREDIHFINTN